MGMKLGIGEELGLPSLTSIGGREAKRRWIIRRQNGVDVEDIAVKAFRLPEGAGAETVPGSNLFLQSWQMSFRSLSSSS